MNKRLKNLIFVALFSAFATLLYSYFRYPAFVSFYKIDISESIVMLGSLILGPLPGVAIQVFKNVIKIVMSGSNSAGIGDLADLISGILYILPATILFAKQNKRGNLIVSLLVGSVLSVLGACFINYYVMLPMFAPSETIISIGQTVNTHINSLFDFILYITAPFNLIKCVINSVIVVLCEKKLKTFFDKKILK